MSTLSVIDMSDHAAITELEKRRIEVIRAMKEQKITHIVYRGEQVRNERERKQS